MLNPDAPPPWHRRRWAGWLVRACGVVLLLVAWRAGLALVSRGHAARADGLDYALGVIAFLGASAGAAATLLGAHLFDQVPIASRWGQASSLDAAAANAGAQRGAAMASRPPSIGSPRPDR